MAALLGVATVAGPHGSASSMQLLGPRPALDAAIAAAANQHAPVILAQSSDPSIRVQQLEEEIRNLNGRIEEMSFQLLQMQEQMRKTQEDNEFRFQDLEKGGSKKSGALDKPVNGGGQSDSVAEIITQHPAPGSNAGSAPLAQPEQVLGSIELDSSGMPSAATINQGAVGNGSGALPGVETTRPKDTASLGSESDLYQVAYAHVLSGDYAMAENEFTDFISSHPQSSKAADANFWLGEAQYSQGKYNESAKTFLNAHQAYGSSPKAPEMLLKLGMSLAALDNTETACATLREVTKRYPKASRAVVSKVAAEQKRLRC
ncbi:tol-pal system protein YbgF [Ciceribacter naphthalenivorans]|uniref:Cell division coordinator CpoB n=3 Tax=Pseudomonadota TaxID=1224 RepID=A0A512HPF5_9HYPH|nr:tol-pal system protein YbgF [Ciceribacter naphthalenivorans]GLR22773.1 tol-pal system protein YbgF [Ciceribacter naphthalenivorans]GLT05629.1 tol-pal system protein YbgF [Sphingomonas psychrolutea]